MKLNMKHPIKNDFTIKKSVSQITDNNNDSNSNSNDNDNDTQIEYTNDNKRSEKTKEKEEMARNIEKRFKRNRIIFYFIILYFQLFSWYFISCFCALYKKTQKQLGKDIRLGMLVNLISSLFISFYILIIRIMIIRGSFCNKIFNCKKCLKNSKFLKSMLKYINEEIIIYAIQKTIELLLVYYIIK